MQFSKFEYKVTTLGLSRFNNLEAFGSQLQHLLDTESEVYAQEGWELWQFDALSDPQGNNGLILIYRRPKSGY